MNHRFVGAKACAILAGVLTLASAASAADNAPKSAAPQLADRMERMAYFAVQNYRPIPPILHETSALLQAAARLNPTEPRYLRLLYQARIQAADPDGAINALQGYLKLVPDDQFAQVKLIDLYVSRMQTADTILNYLRGVVGKMALPPVVRAHAAVECAQTLLDHSQKDEALKMVDAALQIDPLSTAALKLKYRLTQNDGPVQRCGLLLAILKSNPVDPDAATSLANDLASLGLATSAAVWYAQAANLYTATATPRAPDLGKGAAIELYLCDHTTDAASVIDSYLKDVPSDPEGWVIRLAIAKDSSSDPIAFSSLTRQAGVEDTNLLQATRAAFGAPNATTQPSAAIASDPAGQAIPPVPDLSGDMALLVKTDKARLTDQYITAAADLAWLRLYFLRDAGPVTQQLIDSLTKILPPDDVELARLVGWNYLVQGKYPQARQKLSAVADRDAYSTLGMALLDEAAGNKANSDALARASLANYPSGPAAAVLYSAFRGRGAKVVATHQAAAVTAALDNFPREWINIVAQPRAFYTVTATPLAQQVGFNQAILAKITILNTGDFDLTMGDHGVLRPDMILDAGARGLIEKQMPGAIFEQYWQRLLLPKGQSCSQVVRLDRGVVDELLEKNPTAPIDLIYTVNTNPIPTKQGFALGAAGYQVPFKSTIERVATPISTPQDRQALYGAVIDSSPPDRLNSIETISTLALGLRLSAAGDNSDQSLAAAKEMFDHARQGLADTDHAVSAWTGYLFALANVSLGATPDQQETAVRQLTTSDDWYARLLGVVASQRLADHGAVVASVMSNDPDAAVREYAKGVSEVITQAAAAAATQPAAQP